MCRHEFKQHGKWACECKLCGVIVPNEFVSLLIGEENFTKEWLEYLLEIRDEWRILVPKVIEFQKALEFYAKWKCSVLADEGETAEKILEKWKE